MNVLLGRHCLYLRARTQNCSHVFFLKFGLATVPSGGHSLPHEDPTFLRKIVASSSSQDDLETMWALQGISSSGSGGQAQDVMKTMMHSHLQAYGGTATDSLRLFSLACRKQILSDSDKFYKCFLVELYADAGLLQNALTVLRSMSRDTRHKTHAVSKGGAEPMVPRVIWEKLLEEGKEQRKPKFSLQVRDVMEEMGVVPNKKMVKLLMEVCAENHMFEEALDICQSMMRGKGMNIDVHTYGILIKACTRSMEKTVDVLDSVVNELMTSLPQKKIPHRIWSSILMAYAADGNVERVQSYASMMKDTYGIELNARDYVAIVRAWRESQTLLSEQMPEIYAMIRKTGDVSLATEVIRYVGMMGSDVEESIHVFDMLGASGTIPDRGLYNVMIDLVMSHQDQDKEYMKYAWKLFDLAWEQGVFNKERRLSKQGFTAHIDLHRTGLWTAQFCIIQHLKELFLEYLDGEKKTPAVKFISGKGRGYKQDIRQENLSLIDVVRQFLSMTKIVHYEDSVGVFSVPRSHLTSMFREWKRQKTLPEFADWFVDPKLY